MDEEEGGWHCSWQAWWAGFDEEWSRTGHRSGSKGDGGRYVGVELVAGRVWVWWGFEWARAVMIDRWRFWGGMGGQGARDMDGGGGEGGQGKGLRWTGAVEYSDVRWNGVWVGMMGHELGEARHHGVLSRR